MPYFASVQPGYEGAAVRLVVVGKETNGWGDRSAILQSEAVDAVRRLMAGYVEFALGSGYPGKASFWTPVTELYRRLNPLGTENGFVALNVSKLDYSGRQPTGAAREAQLQLGILQEELRILEPHVVVFHTGPDYESWLDSLFPGIVREGDMWLARLRAQGLPKATFRTYHPRYLNYRSRRSEIYERIVHYVENAA